MSQLNNQPVILRPGASQTLTQVALASASSAPISFGVNTVRIVSTQPAFVTVGLPALAATSTNGMYLPAGVAEYINVPAEGVISVYPSGTAGFLYITEMSR